MRASVCTTVVGLALLAAGCTSDPEDGPAPTSSAKPVPTRELVVWADQMCTNLGLLDRTKRESAARAKEILTPISINPQPPDVAADHYLSFTGHDVMDFAQGLEAIERSGISPADQFAARWGKQVDATSRRIETLTDFSEVSGLESEQKIERAQQVAKLVAEIPRPEPEFLAVLEKDPRLAAAHQLAPRCVPPKPAPTESVSTVLPKAKDGTNLDACEDGNCEILVTKTVDLTAGPFELELSFQNSKVTATYTPLAEPVGTIQLTAVGSTGSFGNPDGDKLTIEAVGINRKGAVLKLTAT